jgi:hypothetical protein
VIILKKETKKFEKAMRTIIKAVINNEPISEPVKNNTEALHECISREYIAGVKFGRSQTGEVFTDFTHAYVRYKGIEFLENKHPNLRYHLNFIFSIVSIILSTLSVAFSFLSKYFDIVAAFHRIF